MMSRLKLTLSSFNLAPNSLIGAIGVLQEQAEVLTMLWDIQQIFNSLVPSANIAISTESPFSLGDISLCLESFAQEEHDAYTWAIIVASHILRITS